MIIKCLFFGQKITIEDDIVECQNKDIKNLFEYWMNKNVGMEVYDGYLSDMIKVFGKNLEIISIEDNKNTIY